MVDHKSNLMQLLLTRMIPSYKTLALARVHCTMHRAFHLDHLIIDCNLVCRFFRKECMVNLNEIDENKRKIRRQTVCSSRMFENIGLISRR